MFDREIAAVARTLPDFDLFDSLPGAGPHLTPRLLAAFGEQRDRFKGADELQKYSGIAPVTERSGKKCWVHWRWQCPTFLRQTFVEWAGQTIKLLADRNAVQREHLPQRPEETRFATPREPRASGVARSGRRVTQLLPGPWVASA